MSLAPGVLVSMHDCGGECEEENVGGLQWARRRCEAGFRFASADCMFYRYDQERSGRIMDCVMQLVPIVWVQLLSGFPRQSGSSCAVDADRCI